MIEWDIEDKHLIEEISALTGLTKLVIQEVFEFQFINIIERFSKDPLRATTIKLPLVGELYVKYTDDDEQPDGSIKTNFNSFISLSQTLKSTLAKIISDSPEDTSTVVDQLLQEKIDNTIFSSLESD
jgi:hypothetical protein